MAHPTKESPNGTKREGAPGLPYAGHPMTDHASILAFYFEHPVGNHENP